jgi:hypothetical protein
MMDGRIAMSLAEAVRGACLEAAARGYEDAAISGLCHEGAVQASLDAIRMIELGPLVAQLCDDAQR